MILVCGEVNQVVQVDLIIQVEAREELLTLLG